MLSEGEELTHKRFQVTLSMQNISRRLWKMWVLMVNSYIVVNGCNQHSPNHEKPIQ